MPTLQHEGDQDSAWPEYRTSSGILAGPDRVVRLQYLSREVAYATEYQATRLKDDHVVDGERYVIEWVRWAFPVLYWTHTVALLSLQGASLQQVLPGWLVLRGDRLPAYSPRPGAKEVVLADIHDPPTDLTHRQLFELLLPSAGGACAPGLF